MRRGSSYGHKCFARAIVVKHTLFGFVLVHSVLAFVNPVSLDSTFFDQGFLNACAADFSVILRGGIPTDRFASRASKCISNSDNILTSDSGSASDFKRRVAEAGWIDDWGTPLLKQLSAHTYYIT